MKRIVSNAIMAILLVLITFFGLGPVLMADGTDEERLFTLLIVIGLYIILLFGFYFTNRGKKNK